MADDDIRHLRERFDDFTAHIDKGFERLEKIMNSQVTIGQQNSQHIAQILTRQESCGRDWSRNWEQHTEYYNKIEKLDKSITMAKDQVIKEIINPMKDKQDVHESQISFWRGGLKVTWVIIGLLGTFIGLLKALGKL